MDITSQRLVPQNDDTLTAYIDACIIIVVQLLIGDAIADKCQGEIKGTASACCKRREGVVEFELD